MIRATEAVLFFDCRAVNNPGKYERYAHYTGLDESVIQFLEEDGEILTFLENAYNLVDASEDDTKTAALPT